VIVPGDAAGCAALGSALTRAATGTAQASQQLESARDATPGWQGEAGGAWRATASKQVAAAGDLAQALAAAGRALSRFAADLEAAQQLAARAQALAADVCLSLSATGSVPAVHVPMGPYVTSEQADDAARARRLAETRTDVLDVVRRAKEAERLAHDTLRSSLSGLAAAQCPAGRPGAPSPAPQWNDYLELGNELLLLPRRIADGQSALAAAQGRFARELRTKARQATGSDAAALRRLRNAELRDMRAWRSSAATWAARADDVDTLVPWVRHAERTLHGSLPVLRRAPVVGVGLTGLGIAVDVGEGKPAGTAVASNVTGAVAATVAAPLLTAGAATLMGTATVAAAPVVLGVVAAGVVGYGVGKVVEHWGDDVVEGVGDLAGEAWDSVFG
jgi:hypothetical protein